MKTLTPLLDRFRSMDHRESTQARIEIANSYRSVMNSLAWRHLTELIEKEYADSYKAEDQCAIQDLTVGVAARARGIREGLDRIKKGIQSAIGFNE